MKLAIILRGISYYDNLNIKVSNSETVDFQECIDSMNTNLIVPLKEVFDEIDFFIVTYASSKLNEVVDTLKPRDAMIYPASTILVYRHRITVKLMIDCLTVIEPYEEYDHILMTRFDLFFYRPLDLSKINFDKFNFGWKGEIGQCDDSFWLFRRKHIPSMKQYLNNDNFGGNSCHDYNRKIGDENCNYISKPLDPANGYHMPDFWLFARYLPEFYAGKYKLYDWPPENENIEKIEKRDRLAIIFRGIMFYDGKEKVCYSNRPVDYKECLDSMWKNLLSPLKKKFRHIDFFIVTYANDRMPDILSDFGPRDMIIYPRSSIMTFRRVITVKLISDVMNLIEPYKNEYDNILITRADLFYYNKPLDLNKINFDKFNFGWKNLCGHCDDSFWLVAPKHLPVIRNYTDEQLKLGTNNCHTMHNYIPEEERHYISQWLDYDSSTHTGHGMPDFWFFGRYLPVWDKENRVLHTEDGDLILYD